MENNNPSQQQKSIILIDGCMEDLEGARQDSFIEDVYNSQQLFGGFSVHNHQNIVAQKCTEVAEKCRNNGQSYQEMLSTVYSFYQKQLEEQKQEEIQKELAIKREQEMMRKQQEQDRMRIEQKQQEKKSHPILGTLSFWAAFWLGPLLIYALVYLSYWFAGGTQGFFFHMVQAFLAFALQPISCFLAFSLAKHFSSGISPVVNAVVAIMIILVLGAFDMYYENYARLVSYGISVIVLIVCVVMRDRVIDVLAS